MSPAEIAARQEAAVDELQNRVAALVARDSDCGRWMPDG
jgi:hypothetical protein